MAAMIAAAGLSGARIELKSVAPEELAEYYESAHYGFILRDDNVINTVANPTKMIEYLQYGIVPIVKSPNIGDFATYGYDYITYDSPLSELKPVKSPKNREVAREIISRTNDVEFRTAVLETRRTIG